MADEQVTPTGRVFDGAQDIDEQGLDWLRRLRRMEELAEDGADIFSPEARRELISSSLTVVPHLAVTVDDDGQLVRQEWVGPAPRRRS